MNAASSMRFDSNTGASQSVYRQNDALDLIYYAGLLEEQIEGQWNF